MADVNPTTTDADNLAEDLFTNLVSGTDFSLPEIDLSAPEFQAPDVADNPLYGEVTRLTEADLTTREVGGSGLFDGLMAAFGAQLKTEYEKGRITGNDYAQAYVQLTTAAMAQATQFLLGRDQAYWSAQIAKHQAQATEVQVTTERANLELAKAKLMTGRVETYAMQTQYANGKLQLAVADAQRDGIIAQTDQTEYQTGTLMPQQLLQMQQETGRLEYEVTYLMPKELEKSTKTIESITADISAKTAQKDQVLYQTANILPAELAGLQADKSIKDYQLSDQLPAQVAGITADTVGKTYNNDFILPAQLENLSEQMEANRAKTLDTRSDGTTPITGAIGKQKELHAQQIDSYKRDSEWKMAKGLLDTWITQKSMDEGLTPPESLTDANINTVMGKIRANLGLE